MEDKTLLELIEIIITLKTKHCQEGVTCVEHKRYKMAKTLYRQNVQNLHHVLPVGSGNNISFD